MDKEKCELIRRIASVVGHELRNPLAVIGNSSYFIKTKLGATADPKVAKHLAIIASEISRADQLIADMLAFSRPLELKTSAVALDVVVHEALESCAMPDTVKVKRENSKTAVLVQADAAALALAFRRLMDNAVEAMEGKGALTVAIGARGSSAFLEVRDTGPGIKPEALPSIFQPFFTTKPRGLGLGLAMAEKILSAHGGKVEAKNLPDRGAVVTLSLPLL